MTNNRPANQGVADERGFAAIVIAIMLVTVLSLLTVSFALLMRNEQTNALNRELSNDAYYAAEAGVNDAVKALSIDPTIEKTSCAPGTADGSAAAKAYVSNNQVSSPNNQLAQYSCLLINPSPNDLRFSPVGDTDDSDKTFVMYGNDIDNPEAFKTVTFSWSLTTPLSAGHYFANQISGLGADQFPPVTGWQTPSGQGVTGVLRIELVPLNSLDPASTINGAFTAFLYPSTSGTNQVAYIGNGSSPTAPASQGPIVDGDCSISNSPLDCSVTVNGLTNSIYLVRIDSIYNPSTVFMTATGSNGGMPIAGVQSLVDSTGESQNVLRRIQVRVPSQPDYDRPQFDIEATGSICKLVTIDGSDDLNNTDNCPN